MKFETPKFEVKKFDVADVLTTSGEISQLGAMMEGECRGNAWDNTLDDNCI